jgi:hypothetical protein
MNVVYQKGKKLFEHNFFVWALTGVISVYLVTSLLVCSVTLLLPCIQCEFWLTLSITTSLFVYGSIVRSMIIWIILRTYILIALYWNLNYRQSRGRVEASSWLRQGLKGWRATERGKSGVHSWTSGFWTSSLRWAAAVITRFQTKFGKKKRKKVGRKRKNFAFFQKVPNKWIQTWIEFEQTKRMH